MNSVTEWNEYWSTKPQEEALFTDASGKAIGDFKVYWAEYFRNKNLSSGVIDIACGSGSLFASVGQLSTAKLSGLDCSQNALALFSKRFPTADTFLNTSSELPKEPISSHAIIVSQFGIEYLGVDAILSVPEMMSAGAEFNALCHYKDGHIHARYSNEKASLSLLFTLRAFDKAREICQLLEDDGTAAAIKKEHFFSHITMHRDKWNGGSLYFVQGIYQMLSNSASYDTNDIIDWINGIEVQLRQSFERISTICDVALSASDIDVITKSATGESGTWSSSPFFLEGSTLPVAWSLSFKKNN